MMDAKEGGEGVKAIDEEEEDDELYYGQG